MTGPRQKCPSRDSFKEGMWQITLLLLYFEVICLVAFNQVLFHSLVEQADIYLLRTPLPAIHCIYLFSFPYLVFLYIYILSHVGTALRATVVRKRKKEKKNQ